MLQYHTVILAVDHSIQHAYHLDGAGAGGGGRFGGRQSLYKANL